MNRDLLLVRLEMAELLHRLESGLRRSTGASERLKAQVVRIDEYMRSQGCSDLLPGLQQIPISEENHTQARFTSLGNNHQDSMAPIPTTVTGFDDQLSHIQLPPELLGDWPWSFDPSSSEGMFPLPFIN